MLNETPTQWVLYAIHSPRTLRYDGLALPGAGNPFELIRGRRLKSIRDGVLHQVVLDFEEGEAKILVVDK